MGHNDTARQRAGRFPAGVACVVGRCAGRLQTGQEHAASLIRSTSQRSFSLLNGGSGRGYTESDCHQQSDHHCGPFATGHLVSQMAWTDYAVQLTHKGSWALAWLAPGTAAWIHQKASHAQAFQRQKMPLWTQTLSVAGKVAQSHNQRLLMALPGRLLETNQKAGGLRTRAKINWLQARQFQSVHFQGRVRQAALSHREWLNARNWSQSFFGLAKLRKRGNTQEVDGQWVAQDQLSFKVRRLFRSKTVTLAQGQSNSRTYGYAGVQI